MEKFVLTIARQFGSRGRSIAQRTAALLGVDFYDRDIIEEAARRTNLPLSAASDEEETAKTSIARKLLPLGPGTTQMQDTIFAAQESIIRDLAEEKSCILVGRCADYILRDEKNLLRVYIYAPLEKRIEYCTSQLFMSERDARRACQDIDRARENYHLRYAGYAPGDPACRDMMLNSGTLGVELTAQYLAEAVKLRFGG